MGQDVTGAAYKGKPVRKRSTLQVWLIASLWVFLIGIAGDIAHALIGPPYLEAFDPRGYVESIQGFLLAHIIWWVFKND